MVDAPRRGRAWASAAAALAAPWLLVPTARAQMEPTGAPGSTALPLDAALRAAVLRHPRVQVAAQEVARARAAQLQAAGAFDGQLSVSSSNARASQVTAAPSVAAGFVRSDAEQTAYSVGWAQQLRTGGIVVEPQVSAVQLRIRGEAPTYGTGTVALRVTAPLLGGRGGTPSLALERSAAAAYEGSTADGRFAALTAAYDALVTYGRYAAAQEQLAVTAAAEQRARRLVEETRELVRADERPASDTLQLLANVAAKSVQRINAEQGVTAAREQLGLAMGLGGMEALALGPAATPLPRRAAAPPPSVEVLVRVALAQREDLSAAGARVRAAEDVLGSASSAQQPRLDLTLQTGYSGLAMASGVNGLVSPLYRNVGGLSTQLQLSYRLAGSNALARGRTAGAAAQLEQARVARGDAERRVVSGVGVAVAAVESATLALARATEAQELATIAVDNERRKFRVGNATLFDIVNAEDALTSAELARLGASRGYAEAVAGLRLTTGTLLVPSDDPQARPAPVNEPWTPPDPGAFTSSSAMPPASPPYPRSVP